MTTKKKYKKEIVYKTKQSFWDELNSRRCSNTNGEYHVPLRCCNGYIGLLASVSGGLYNLRAKTLASTWAPYEGDWSIQAREFWLKNPGKFSNFSGKSRWNSTRGAGDKRGYYTKGIFIRADDEKAYSSTWPFVSGAGVETAVLLCANAPTVNGFHKFYTNSINACAYKLKRSPYYQQWMISLNNKWTDYFEACGLLGEEPMLEKLDLSNVNDRMYEKCFVDMLAKNKGFVRFMPPALSMVPYCSGLSEDMLGVIRQYIIQNGVSIGSSMHCWASDYLDENENENTERKVV